jgi:hypothetical protein
LVKANDVTLMLLNREMLNLAPAARPKLAAGAFIPPGHLGVRFPAYVGSGS